MRRFAISIVALIAIAALAGRIYGPVEFMGNVSMGSWSAMTNLTWSATTGGSYTNGTYTNYYRLTGTNASGRLPVSSNVVAVFTGTTNSTNAIIVAWPRAEGVLRYVIERSWDAGATWTNYTTAAASATNWTDWGTNTYTSGSITSLLSVIAAPTSPWTTGTPVYAESDPVWAAVSNQYLKTAGDTMTGPLVMDAAYIDLGTAGLRTTSAVVMVLSPGLGGGTARLDGNLLLNGGNLDLGGGTASNGVFRGDGSGLTNLPASGDFLADGTVPMTGNLNLGGQSATNGSFVGNGAGLTNLQMVSWHASVAKSYAATVTVARTDGPYLHLTLTGNGVLAFNTATYPTNGQSTVGLGLYVGTNSITCGTGINTSDWASLTLATNGWNDLIFRKGYGATQFRVRQ